MALSHIGGTSRKNFASYFSGPNSFFEIVAPKPCLRYAAAQKKFAEVVDSACGGLVTAHPGKLAYAEWAADGGDQAASLAHSEWVEGALPGYTVEVERDDRTGYGYG